MRQALPRFRWWPDGRLWRFALAMAGGALAVPAVFFVAFRLYAAGLPPLDLASTEARSTIVVDRHGALLRPFVMPDGRWRMPVRAAEVDPRYLAMLLAYEDRRFYTHSGIDLRALARAGWQMLRAGRIVSGGSTLSMQVARLVEPRAERTIAAKIRQMARAVELERRLGKAGILDLYLSLAPFGGNLEGIRAASLAWFGREPKRLSTAEAALLVAIPQAPEARRPDRAPAGAKAGRARVLARIAAAGILPAPDLERAAAEAMPVTRHAFPQHAAHRAEALVAAFPASRRIETSFERDWQAALQRLAGERAEALDSAISVAIVVIENATGRVRASVGGARYLEAARAGGMDLTRAVRSPGSALKPFIYGLAFEDGIAHPETMVEDRPLRFGAYAPENFDPGYLGMVSARQALQMSLNLPAVDLLSLYGPQRFLTRLNAAGAALHLPRRGQDGGSEASAPGLAIALGGLGITLHDLTMLYAGIARGGVILPTQEIQKGEAAMPQAGTRLLGPVPAWYIADILRLAPPPDHGPTGRIAFKTGTSYGYRDAFAIGFDRVHTIGVWVGRADNASVPGLVGRKVAAPILFDAFHRIGLKSGLPPRPRDAITASNAQLPPPLRHLRQDKPKTIAALAEHAVQIAFPPDGATIDLSAEGGRQALVVKLQGGKAPFTWLVNGAPVGGSVARRAVEIEPQGLGFTEISVVDGRGQSHAIRVRLQ